MRSFLRGFVYAFDGIVYVLRTQRNARVHLGIMVLVLAAGILFRVTALEWAVLAITMSLVFSAEMFNTAVKGRWTWRPRTSIHGPRPPRMPARARC
jgi:diacylglycerol kinase (ATP)